MLISEACGFARNISSKLMELGKWMQEAAPSSQDALDAIEAYKKSHGCVIDVKPSHNPCLTYILGLAKNVFKRSLKFAWVPIFIWQPPLVGDLLVVYDPCVGCTCE
jgi:hypothetical protein